MKSEREPAGGAPADGASAAPSCSEDEAREQPSDPAGSELHLQAAQLATHLQEKQRDLDLRESQLNARVAELESQVRTTRLWEQEQVVLAAEREQELKLRIQELEVQATEVAASAVANEEELRKSRAELTRRATQLARQDQELIQARRQLHQAQTEFQAVRDQSGMAAPRNQPIPATQMAGHEHADPPRRELDQQKDALESLRQDLSALQRVCLEMRTTGGEAHRPTLAQDETRVESVGPLPVLPEATAHLQSEERRLQQQRQELLEVGERLQTQQVKLQDEHAKLQQWAEQNRMNLERLAEYFSAE